MRKNRTIIIIMTLIKNTQKKRKNQSQENEGVGSSHSEAALLILGLISDFTRQYLRAAKAWQVRERRRGEEREGGPNTRHHRVNPIKQFPLHRIQDSCGGLDLRWNAFFLKILKQQIMVCTFFPHHYKP